MSAVDHLADFSTSDDTLVLASVSSKAEFDLLSDWLQSQRPHIPRPASRCCGCRTATVAATGRRTRRKLNAAEDRTVVPVRVFWVPGGLHPGEGRRSDRRPRDHRPPQMLQRAILKKDPSRARIVAGEPAKVSELRQQWRENTVGGNPAGLRPFRPAPGGPCGGTNGTASARTAYKSPQLITDELMASSQFMKGLDGIRAPVPRRPRRCSTSWPPGGAGSRWTSSPTSGAPSSAGASIPGSTTTPHRSRRCASPSRTIRRSSCGRTGPYLDGVIVPVALQENKLPPAHTFAGINLSFGFMGPLMRRSGVIFLRRKLDDPLYKYVLRQFVGYIVSKRFNLSWSIEGTRSRTGKMLPPKLGLLSYVADAYLDGRARTSSCSRRRSASTSCTRPPSTPPTPAAGRRSPKARVAEINFVRPRGAQLRQDLRALPRSGVDAPVPR